MNMDIEPNKQVRKINITQLASWITTATLSNKDFLLKPNDLRMLYMFVLWEYINTNNVKSITSDSEIEITEEKLISMVKLFFNEKYYSFFNKIYKM